MDKATKTILAEKCILTSSICVTTDGEMACSIYTLFIHDKHLYTYSDLSFTSLYPKHGKSTNKYARRNKRECVIVSSIPFTNLQGTNTYLGNVIFSEVHNADM